MKGKSIAVLATILTILCISTVNSIQIADAQTATVNINPATIELSELQVGGSFKVNVTVEGVTNLWQWILSLNWNPSKVNLTDIREGPFLETVGQTMTGWPEGEGIYENYFNKGFLPEASSTILTPGTSANGSGVLLTFTFKILAIGDSDLTLNSTLKEPKNEDNEHPLIQHTTISGHITIQQESSPTASPSSDATSQPSSSPNISENPVSTTSPTASPSMTASPSLSNSPSQTANPSETSTSSPIPSASSPNSNNTTVQSQPIELYVMIGAGVVIATVIVTAAFMQRRAKADHTPLI